MKRTVSALLVCLLLCGLAMPMALAVDPIDVSDAVPLALGVATKVGEGKVFSFSLAATGWVKFAVVTRHSFNFTVYDDELNPIVQTNGVSAPIVKLMAGTTYYLTFVYLNTGDISDFVRNNTVTPSLSQPPALKSDVMKLLTGSTVAHNPFQDNYAGVTYTVDGQEPSALGFRHVSVGFEASKAAAVGTYQLQFTNYDGEDLGTLTIVFEDLSLLGWLTDILTGLQLDWSNDDKTTGEWLKLVGKDFLFLFASPVIALMIFFCGPMGWILLPVAFLPFTQLFKDIGGLVTSIFR